MISIGNLQINKLCLGDVSVSKAYLGDVEVYNSTPPAPPEPEGKYMTITALDGTEGTTIAPNLNGNFSTNPNLQYRVNNGEWSDFVFGTTPAIHLVSGYFVQWKGLNTNGISISDGKYMNFSISGNPVHLSGNVMSLIDGVGETLVVPCDFCFWKLFSTSNVKTVSQDFLPANTLSYYCYFGMFQGCTSLVNAP